MLNLFTCSKLIRFQDDPQSEQDVKNLQDEIGDVMCMIEIMKHSGHTMNKLENE